MDFPQLTMTLPDGREESIMKRTTLVRRRHSNMSGCGESLMLHLIRRMELGRCCLRPLCAHICSKYSDEMAGSMAHDVQHCFEPL